MRCLVIDDELPLAESLKMKIGLLFPQFTHVDAVTDSSEGLRYIRRHADTRIVFLDMDMPGIHGMEVMKIMESEKLAPTVVVVSGHRDFNFIQSAWKHRAHTYITKPVDMDELSTAIREILDRSGTKNEEPKPQHINIPTAPGTLRIAPEDILYIKPAVRKSHLVRVDGTHEIVFYNISEMEKLLAPYPFFRAGRFALLNEHKIGGFINKSHSVVMRHLSHSENVNLGRGGYYSLVKYLNEKTDI